MPAGEWTFSVRVADHDVTIHGDGRLFVDGALVRSDLPLGCLPR